MLKLIPPRKGRSKNYRIRGTYLGVGLDESAGTHREAAARAVLRRREREIEGGLVDRGARTTFAEAALEYLKSCPKGQLGRVNRLLDHFADTPIGDIDNAAIKACAADAYPPGPADRPSPRNATINREIVGPIAAVLHHAEREIRVRRYKEPAGRIRTDTPEEIEAFLAALPAEEKSKTGKYKGKPRWPRAAALFVFSTNARRGDLFGLDWDDVRLDQARAVFGATKNGEPRVVHLNDRVVAALANLPHRDGKVFGYRHVKQISDDWRAAAETAGVHGLTPHGGRHDFATWMRQGGADLVKIMQVGGWRDIKSVVRYAHVPGPEQRDAFDASPLNQKPATDAAETPIRGKAVESPKPKKATR